MKTCNKCHVAKASECFSAKRNQCIACIRAANMKSAKLRKQTTKGRLRVLYNDSKQRHKKKHEGELITLERFKAIYLAQNGVCVKTGVPFDLQSKGPMPSPDRLDI